ncbi:hypothetical protein [Athalassotoga sp.]|uniref:hypothetical protein n=1 Tax=Athalassotoga sp. TaxID=2022597 RepID=UPI003CFFCCE5
MRFQNYKTLTSRLIGKRIERLGIVITPQDRYIAWEFRTPGGSIILKEARTDDTITFEEMPKIAKQVRMMESIFWSVYSKDPLTATVFLLKVMDHRPNREVIDEIIRVFSLPDTEQERFWWSRSGIERHIKKFHKFNKSVKEEMVEYSKL